MKVKAIKPFLDLVANTMREIGDTFEVSAERGKALTTVNNKSRSVLCEEVKETAPKKERAVKNAKQA